MFNKCKSNDLKSTYPVSVIPFFSPLSQSINPLSLPTTIILSYSATTPKRHRIINLINIKPLKRSNVIINPLTSNPWHTVLGSESSGAIRSLGRTHNNQTRSSLVHRIDLQTGQQSLRAHRSIAVHYLHHVTRRGLAIAL